MLEFAQKSHQQSMKNHRKSSQNGPKPDQNRPKTIPKSTKMRPWSVFGIKSRPGRLQEVPGTIQCGRRVTKLAQYGVPSGHLGAQRGPKIH